MGLGRTRGNSGDAAAPAVAYVRMSTDLQRYSTENQLDRIRRFAEARGFEIVRTYEDAGRSGLTMDGREALQRLMADVTSGAPDFQAILVYDVSRWGRFQDADEGAYHEHVCRRAGITVHYCAEQFDNDGSIGSTLLKAVKRVMAGEYSRELSVKVFAGQCRLVQRGYRQGGMAGYGLRRLLVDEHGGVKAELTQGERKSLQTDRVVLVPGPDEEVATVRRMYCLFTSGVGEREIADGLNRDGIATDLGRVWTRGSVHQVLTNAKYVGDNVFNRVSCKLRQRRTVNDPSLWVVAKGAFTPLVEAHVFERARAIVEERCRRFDDGELLALLTELLRATGALSSLVIDERDDMPSSSVYRRRFGSLLRAYRLVGYAPDRDYRYLEVNRRLRSLHPEVVAMIVAGLEGAGGEVLRDPATDLLTCNGEFTASVVIARYQETAAGSARWRIRLDAGIAPDVTVAVRMGPENSAPLDYYVLPRIDMTEPRLRLAEWNGLSLDGYRFDDLGFFFSLAARATLTEAA
ncbi:recombinase family protein [Methylobacterium sp. E-005]|uniref:recombinase family protein n=1 Tax=Methylobacterium sp. E-005 TaxID=2836549 RepID=UPI0028C45559|nr:recombinase family protein [Methylobacterium sp. E-005]